MKERERVALFPCQAKGEHRRLADQELRPTHDVSNPHDHPAVIPAFLLPSGLARRAPAGRALGGQRIDGAGEVAAATARAAHPASSRRGPGSKAVPK